MSAMQRPLLRCSALGLCARTRLAPLHAQSSLATPNSNSARSLHYPRSSSYLSPLSRLRLRSSLCLPHATGNCRLLIRSASSKRSLPPAPLPTIPATSPTFGPLSSFPPLSSLTPVYSCDRSAYFRRLTLFSAASLALVWLPLSYASLFVASPPLYPTLIGPLATVAVLVATHFRASRVVASLHLLDPRTLLLSTHSALGPPRALAVPFLDLTTAESIVRSAASPGSAKEGEGYWPIALEGHRRYFLVDKAGEVQDRAVMRRVVGDQPELRWGTTGAAAPKRPQR